MTVFTQRSLSVLRKRNSDNSGEECEGGEMKMNHVRCTAATERTDECEEEEKRRRRGEERSEAFMSVGDTNECQTSFICCNSLNMCQTAFAWYSFLEVPNFPYIDLVLEAVENTPEVAPKQAQSHLNATALQLASVLLEHTESQYVLAAVFKHDATHTVIQGQCGPPWVAFDIFCFVPCGD